MTMTTSNLELNQEMDALIAISNAIAATHSRDELINVLLEKFSSLVPLDDILLNEKIERQIAGGALYKHQPEKENLYPQEEIYSKHNYNEIIGCSSVMNRVFQMISQVAETQSTVLILGETGTGKELIARAIHNNSPRRDKVMIKVNCATLPANLIESELFGHERGAFTGATDKRIGKFELANHSTLFLDEVGELPLDLQVKLLRALQEKEIERVGGRNIIKVDVRIVAATNRNLLKEVHAGNFRSDLYFRLNVFPVTLPALRDRKDDIATLACHFLAKHSKNNKGQMRFTAKAMKQLLAYNWPGNVRELEHVMERSILLTCGTTIDRVYVNTDDEELMEELDPGRVKTIDEVEREHIISILKKCNNKIAGIGGAAELLKIPSTTLNSKMRRLNIKKGMGD
jgi:formate hydrogenlyase transcriptional activator